MTPTPLFAQWTPRPFHTLLPGIHLMKHFRKSWPNLEEFLAMIYQWFTITLLETNVKPVKIQWFEDEIPFGMANFQGGELLVSGSVDIFEGHFEWIFHDLPIIPNLGKCHKDGNGSWPLEKSKPCFPNNESIGPNTDVQSTCPFRPTLLVQGS